MELKNRDSFLALATRRYQTVTIPEFGDVRIQSLSEGERAKIETEAAKDNFATLRARLVAACLVDEDGTRLFGDDECEAIGRLDSRYVAPIADAINDHCEVIQLEDAAKN